MAKKSVPHRSPVSPTEPYGQALKIRISKNIWNACEPRKVSRTDRLTKPASKRKSSSTPAQKRRKKKFNYAETDKSSKLNNETENEKHSVSLPSQSTRCKVKLWRFLYSQPRADSITYDTPCLQPTCANCLECHAHLIGQVPPGGYVEQRQRYQALLDFEPISPAIDPRLLDGTWEHVQSRRASVQSLASLATSSVDFITVLTPVDKGFTTTAPCLDDPITTPTFGSQAEPQKWNIFLPISLINRRAPSAISVRSKWRTGPRRRFTVRLLFPTHEGRGKFKSLVCKREKKEKKRIYDRAYRARKGQAMEQAFLVAVGGL